MRLPTRVTESEAVETVTVDRALHATRTVVAVAVVKANWLCALALAGAGKLTVVRPLPPVPPTSSPMKIAQLAVAAALAARVSVAPAT